MSIPFEELGPWYFPDSIMMLFAVRIIGVERGCLWNARMPIVTGYDWVICENEADYRIAHLSGMWGYTKRLVTQAQLIKMAIDKIYEHGPIA